VEIIGQYVCTKRRAIPTGTTQVALFTPLAIARSGPRIAGVIDGTVPGVAAIG